MTWQLVKLEAESDDRAVRAFVWILLLGCAIWGLVIGALVLWGVTR
jgi:hypothetical protein